MLGEILYGRLSTVGAVTALVSSRIYPMVLPQEPTLPAITYNEVADEDNEGTGHIIRKRVRVIGWALTYAEAKAVGAAVLGALRNYNNDSSNPPLVSTQDDTRSDAFDPDRAFYGDVIEFSCWVVEI